ncbi:DNA polymerase III subunit delta' [Xanthomonadaceae bacterium JHOS43]|nr:DNA polymerase III subunit delta' [Xanthomonadaceae bacterium JHOS43]MCX7563218.1 DNA polymerase III subunit delta' [Xanthomonadaceae bacterium XH05]
MSVALSPWQARAYAQVLVALEAGRLPHALLIGGAVHLGKRALARRLANRLMCSSPQQAEACGQCRNCTLIAAGTHPDLLEETFELNDKGEPRKEILIAQMRRLTEKLMLTPQIAAGQVALIHPAEAMNRSAFNALLKTLEEPPSGRTIILISDQPQRLPATIRSRCQWLRVDLPPRAEALAWLVARGWDEHSAGEALDAAQGNPGLALNYLTDKGLTLRRSVAKDLVALAEQRESAVAVASTWAEDGPARRLRFCGELLRDHLAARHGAQRADLLAQAGLRHVRDPFALATWFDASVRTLNGLDGPMRNDLQIAELLLGWQRLG